MKNKETEYTVRVAADLLSFLMNAVGTTRTNAKRLLQRRLVSVNGVVVSQFDTPLQTGDKVTIRNGQGAAELHHPKLRLVYEDDHLIVVEKKNGLLSVPSAVGSAVAEGVFDKKQGQIRSWFTEDKRNAMVYSSPVDDGGDLAITNYEVLKETANTSLPLPNKGGLSLVELHLETGRTNQIRVHLASIGHPVIGDRKYGHGNDTVLAKALLQKKTDRLCLHARVLEFIHPVTEQTLHFETPVPKSFVSLMAEH